MMTPVEFHWALVDFEATHYAGPKLVATTIRQLAVIVFNSAFGRKKGDMVRKPSRLWKFPWEKEKVHIQTLDQMKDLFAGLAKSTGVLIKQNGKVVKPEDMK